MTTTTNAPSASIPALAIGVCTGLVMLSLMFLFTPFALLFAIADVVAAAVAIVTMLWYVALGKSIVGRLIYGSIVAVAVGGALMVLHH